MRRFRLLTQKGYHPQEYVKGCVYPEMNCVHEFPEDWQEVLESPWISVEDRLPDIGQDCIVIQNPKTTATKRPLFSTFEERRGVGSFRSYHTSGSGNDFSIGYWVDIIYWMPLPEPPTE